MAFRIDRGTLRSPRKTATGLHVDAYITKAGVFEYRNPDGSIRRELREPAEVFHQDSLTSFAALPVTDNHPPTALDSSNATKYAQGAVGETVRQDGDLVAASLAVFAETLIQKMQAGKAQVSCGYTCDVDLTPGVHPTYGRYDGIQKNIRGNHVAIVDAGRAGPEVCVRLDAAEQFFAIEEKNMDELQKQLAMALRDVAEQRARADTAEVKLKDATARIDVAEALALSEKARADAAEKVRADTISGIPAAVSARVVLITTASKVLKQDKLDTLSDRDIKILVIKHIDDIVVDPTRSDDFVDALFMSASKRADAVNQSVGAIRTSLVGNRQDAAPNDEAAAKAKMIADNAALSRGGV